MPAQPPTSPPKPSVNASRAGTSGSDGAAPLRVFVRVRPLLPHEPLDTEPAVIVGDKAHGNAHTIAVLGRTETRADGDVRHGDGRHGDRR
eukprot:315887-Pleurochrysis_carterae.AAC.1